MADAKLTELSGFTPISTDILYGVDDPGGAPVSGKVTVAAVLDIHATDSTDAHDASAISVVPAGNITETDVQSALEELDAAIDAIPGGGSTIPNDRLAVAQFDTEAVITHGLTDADARLVGAYPNWNAGGVYIIDQDATTITVAWPNECPLASGGELVWSVVES